MAYKRNREQEVFNYCILKEYLEHLSDPILSKGFFLNIMVPEISTTS